MVSQPGPHFELLVSGVVVEDDVNVSFRRQLPVDGVEEPDELLMPVALHVAPDHRAIEDVQGGEQVVPFRLQSWVIIAPRPGLRGSPGWVRSSAWNWLFSSTERMIACAGGGP